MTKTDIQLHLAEQEAELIGDLTGRRKLRCHVVGDCATPEAASVVGAAMIKYERKRGKPAWTYTHAWPELPVECWQGARVMASCHKLSEVILAMRAGYPAAVTIEPTTSNKAQCITRDERFRPVEPFTIIPCPAQFRRPDGKRYSVCETCAICQNTDRLMRDRIAVGFQPDYGTSKKLLPLLK